MLGSVPHPSDYCCVFYENQNFDNLMTPQGLCVDHPEYEIDRWVKLSDYGWNNGIGSYTCGKNIIIKLIDEDNGYRETHAAGMLLNYDTYLVHEVDYVWMVKNENNDYMNIFNSEDCSHFSYMFGYDGQGGYT